jgi:hypothetical protein
MYIFKFFNIKSSSVKCDPRENKAFNVPDLFFLMLLVKRKGVKGERAEPNFS